MISPDIASIHRYVAYGSVGASTVRGLRTSGVVSAARIALYSVDLAPFTTKCGSTFHELLDTETKRVKRSLAVLSKPRLKKGELPEDRYSSYLKLKKESEHCEMSYLDKRKKDKAFGRFIKSTKKQLKGKHRVD